MRRPVVAAAVVGLALAAAASGEPAQARPAGPVLPHVVEAQDCGGALVVTFRLERLHGRALTALLDDGAERLEVLEVSGRSGPDGSWQQVPAGSGGEGVLRWHGLAVAQGWGGHFGAARVVRTDGGAVTSTPVPIVSGCRS